MIHVECFLRTNLYFFKSRFTAHVNNAMASNQKTAMIKTLRKWEKEFQVKLDFDINTEYKVCCIWYSDCKKWEPRTKEIKNFSAQWIKGTENVAKDAVEKHIKGEPHLQAVKLSKRSEQDYEFEFATHKKFFESESSRQGFLTSKIQYYVLRFEKGETVYRLP